MLEDIAETLHQGLLELGHQSQRRVCTDLRNGCGVVPDVINTQVWDGESESEPHSLSVHGLTVSVTNSFTSQRSSLLQHAIWYRLCVWPVDSAWGTS